MHLPVIDFGFHRFSLERLCAYVRRAEELGFEAVSTNDHLIYSRPWLDAPTALAAVLSHTGKMAMSEPVLAQQMEGRLGQRDVAVLGALTAVDMDHHALAVDVGDFEMPRFVKAQATGVDGGEKDVVGEVFDLG